MNVALSSREVAPRGVAIVQGLRDLEGPLLLILHDVQAAFGYVPEEAVPVIAQDLNLSRAEVHGIVTFYRDYRSHPPGRHVLTLCRAEARQAMGGDRVAEKVMRHRGIGFHETTADGAVTLAPVYCLGLCSTAPAAMLDGAVHGRLDEGNLDTLMAEARA